MIETRGCCGRDWDCERDWEELERRGLAVMGLVKAMKDLLRGIPLTLSLSPSFSSHPFSLTLSPLLLHPLPFSPSLLIPEEPALAKGFELKAGVAILVVMGVCTKDDGIGIAGGTTNKINKEERRGEERRGERRGEGRRHTRRDGSGSAERKSRGGGGSGGRGVG